MTTVLPTPDFTCPNCGHTKMESLSQRVSIPYGDKLHAQMVYFNTVLRCCRKCGSTFTGPDYEKHQQRAIKEHRLKTDKFCLQLPTGVQATMPFTQAMEKIADTIWNTMQHPQATVTIEGWVPDGPPQHANRLRQFRIDFSHKV